MYIYRVTSSVLLFNWFRAFSAPCHIIWHYACKMARVSFSPTAPAKKTWKKLARIFPCIFNYILLIQCDFNSITFGIEFRQIDSEYPIWCGTIFGRNFGISWVNLLFISSKILNSSNFPAIHHKNDGFSAMSQFFLSVIAVEWQPWSEIGCSHKAWQASKWTWHFV